MNDNKESFEVSSRFWRGLILGVGISATLLYPIREYLHDRNYLRIPTKVEVQEGHVKPSELEISVSDLDRNGKKELVVKYKGKSYLLVENDKGNPRFQKYELEPEEIKPAKINLK